MRKIIAYELLSLDGVAERPDEFVIEFDDVMRENLGRVITAQDAVLLGRRTYEEWVAFWPNSKIEPFGSFINAVRKYVVTSSPLGQEWNNTTVVDGSLPEFVAELRAQPGSHIGVHGSIELAQGLLERGLIDELRLVIAPTLQMNGRRLFDKNLRRRLTLKRSLVSPSGYLLVDYAMES